MKTLKLLIKTSFFNKINDFICFNIIKWSNVKVKRSKWISAILTL